MNRINLIIRGNLLCKGEISAYGGGGGGVTALQTPPDTIIPKVFRCGGSLYDTTDAIVITGDVKIGGDLIASPNGAGLLVTGEACAYAPDGFKLPLLTEYKVLETIEA